MSDSFKKMSDLSEFLTIAHYLWAMWANRSMGLIFGERFDYIAHFWWPAWAICSHRWEEMSHGERIAHIAHQKRRYEQFTHFSINFLKIVYKIYLKQDFRFFSQNFCAKRSFAHLLWATWANYSGSLICLEGSEQMAHSHSLIWAKWANERWANEQIPSTA